MTAVPLGMTLGALNVLVIGIGMAVVGREAGIALLVLAFGVVPAIVLGALLGWLADVMKTMPLWPRRFVLIVPAVLLVVVLGAEFAMQHMILVSCIPTAVATFMLERGTRTEVAPPVPIAHARR
jgi:hypothetical protein